jgi:hypothetical protein
MRVSQGEGEGPGEEGEEEGGEGDARMSPGMIMLNSSATWKEFRLSRCHLDDGSHRVIAEHR